MLSQKDAVYQATMAVLEQNNVNFQDGQNVRDAIKDNLKLRGQIRNLVFEGLKSGQVAFGGDEDQKDEGSLRRYATGLISNWFRKDRRLNGGGRYVPASSRADQHISSGEKKIRQLQTAIDATDDDDLKKRLQEAIEDIRDQEDLQERLANDVKAGRVREDEGFDEQEESKRSQRQEEMPPSYGSGHRGAVTDPEHDRRLKRNESPQLHEARQEAGHRGGTTVAQERGSEFYSKIGQKGGLSRGGRSSEAGHEEDRGSDTGKESGHPEKENFFKMMLRKRA